MQDQSAYHHQIISAQFPEQERLICPRCESTNTKFCYYNNYNLSQPRHYCKNCRRYWTKGGALRNIPVGGGTRKPTKRSSNSKRPNPDPKTSNGLPNDGKDMSWASAGSGHDPTQSSANKPDSVVGSKGQNGNGSGELEPNGLRMKAVDHGGDVDPGSDAGRVSNYRFDSVGSVFRLCEDMDNCNVMKGEKASGLGLGVGMALIGEGVDTSRDSDIGSGHKSGHEELGVNYLSMQNGDSGGIWSKGSSRWTDLAAYNTHDRAFD